jgi:hypothetical protein
MTEQINEPRVSKQLDLMHPTWLWLIPLGIAILFDQLFWGKTLGLIFLVTILLILIGGFVVALIEKKRVPWTSWLLLLPILFGAVMTVFRSEGFTIMANVLMACYALVLLAITFLNGEWFTYRLRDILEGFIKLLISGLIDPIRLAIDAIKKNGQKSPEEKKAHTRKFSPVLRGLLIALPLVILFGGLLASADLIFSSKIEGLFKWIKIENFGEFVFRIIYVVILGYALSGTYIFILTKTSEKRANNTETPLVSPFLGKIEALIVLGAVNLLFLAFLVIQFRYFFGGNANINFEGFTYAEYARKGFFELVTVAIISLLLFFVLSHITKRTEKRDRWSFSILGILLIAQVGVMLLSAHYRLSLYESAYGFTQLRTVTHVFIFWLAGLLLATVLLEAFHKLPRIAVILLLVAMGFMVTLDVLNVDDFIARKNIAHAVAGNELDTNYLTWNLSEDATPALFESYKSGELNDDLSEQLGAVLACRGADAQTPSEDWSWVSWHAAREKADRLYEENANLLAAYDLKESEENGWTVLLDGEVRSCWDLQNSIESNQNNNYLD